MVNNDFHVLGTAITPYQEIHSGNYVSYSLVVEVEKLNSKTGRNFELELTIYGTNKAVDFTYDVLGHQVLVNGYLDSYLAKDGHRVSKVVAQNVYVLDKDRKQTVNPTATVDLVGQIEELSAPVVDAGDPDDDLPF